MRGIKQESRLLFTIYLDDIVQICTKNASDTNTYTSEKVFVDNATGKLKYLGWEKLQITKNLINESKTKIMRVGSEHITTNLL